MYHSEDHPTEDFEDREDHPYTSRSSDDKCAKRPVYRDRWSSGGGERRGTTRTRSTERPPTGR